MDLSPIFICVFSYSRKNKFFSPSQQLCSFLLTLINMTHLLTKKKRISGRGRLQKMKLKKSHCTTPSCDKLKRMFRPSKKQRQLKKKACSVRKMTLTPDCISCGENIFLDTNVHEHVQRMPLLVDLKKKFT